MSQSLLGDILKHFNLLSPELLTNALKQVGAVVSLTAKEDLLQAATVEMLAIGVEDLLNKLDEETRAKLTKKPLSQVSWFFFTRCC